MRHPAFIEPVSGESIVTQGTLCSIIVTGLAVIKGFMAVSTLVVSVIIDEKIMEVEA